MPKTGAALLIAALTLTFAAQAESGEGIALAISTCAAQSDPQVRLACYDQLAAQLKVGSAIGPQVSASAPALAPAPVTPSATPQTPAQTAGQTQTGPVKQDSAWYNPGGWFGGNEPPHATTGTPAQFGAENLPKPKLAPGEPEPLDEITAKVTSVTFSGTGRFTVALDNGQKWRQLESDTGSAMFNRHGGNSVTISRGILGSYNLVVTGHTAMYKVSRIQ